MKWYKKVLWVLLILVAVFVVAVSIYGLGDDLVGVFPAWLTASVVGLVAFVIVIIIASLLALGVVKIREDFKDL